MRSVAIALLVLASACSGVEPLRVGAKSFDEQRVLAEMISSMALSELGEPARVVVCGDTYDCQRALRTGEIDVLVEYTGTVLALSGAVGAESTRAVYEGQDLEAVADLGFANGYALVVATSLAERDGLRTISDLAARGEPIRVAAPSTYLNRPRDGLPSLLRRYGLRTAGRAEVIDDPVDRYRALARGRVDVAIGYETDAALETPALFILADDAGFFPPYRAEVVVRRDALQRFEGLRDLIERLDGRISTEQMRGLLAEVQQEGRAPAEVARRFLTQRDIADVTLSEAGGPELRIAVHPADSLEQARTRAVSAARRAFPDRPTPLRETRDIGGTLASGGARLAVLGAERFFVFDGRALPQRDERLSAVAVLGTRVLHLVRRSDGDRVGGPPSGSGAALLAETYLDRTPDVRGEPRELLRRLADGELDAALVVGPAPHAEVARALRSNPDLWLEPIESPRGPILRPVRIPPGTYPGQDEAVSTAGAQVLLATAASSTQSEQVVGPAAALRIGGNPLTRDEISRLRDALGRAELPDPALPSPWSVQQGAAEPDTMGTQLFDTGANLFTLAFLGWLAFLLLQRRRDDDDADDDDEDAEPGAGDDAA